jgi:hypothetical protein
MLGEEAGEAKGDERLKDLAEALEGDQAICRPRLCG